MSDTTTDAAPVEPAEPAKIDFEKAEFAEPAGEHVACGLCKKAITTEYWQWMGKILCETCREVVRRTTDDARRSATFGKAFLLGGVVALGCGIGYAIFVGLTQIQFALVTIGIGWAVGRAIQRVTRGFGSRKHQVLAVALTYFASTMGYFPAIIKAFSESAHHDDASAPAATSPSSVPAIPDTAAPVEAPPRPQGAERPSLAASIVVVTALSVGLMLAAPFLEMSSGISGLLGLLIIFFGLQTAWRVSRGVSAPVTGPHKVSAAAS